MSELSPEHWQNIAAVNAGTYKMSEDDRQQWYADHPVSAFAQPGSLLAQRAANRAAAAASDAAEAISIGRYDEARQLLAEAGHHLDTLRERQEGQQS